MDAGRIVARVVGAGLLGATAGIHLYLYEAGYRLIPTIGWLFLVNAVAGSLLCLAVLVTPRRWCPVPAVLGAGLEAGTALGLLVAEQHGLFGFVESTQATLFWQSLGVEIAGAAVLAALTVTSGLAVLLNRSAATAVTGK